MTRSRRMSALAAGCAAALLAVAGPAHAAPVIDEFSLTQANSQPLGLAAGSDGAVWFTQMNANRIGRITSTGTISTYAIPSLSSVPEGIAPGPDGRLWFAEHGTDKLGAITTGAVISEYPVTSNSGPVDVAAGPDGAVWFTVGSTGKIGRMTTAGSYTEYSTGSSSSAPQGIAAGPDGALWFAEAGSNKIGRMTTAGAVTEYAVPTASSVPAALAAGPDGALWFTEQSGGKVGRITTSGVVTEYAVPTGSSVPEDIIEGPDGRIWFAELGANKIGALAIPPAATTGTASAIDHAGATLGAALDPNGLTLSYHFEYGTSALYGLSTGSQSVTGSGTQAVSLPVTGLAESTTYHFRVVATSAGGTATGADQTFTTGAAPVVDPPTDTTTPPQDTTTTTPTDSDKSTTVLGDPAAALEAALIVPSHVTANAAGEIPLIVSCPAEAVNGCHGSIVLTLAAGKPRHTHAKPLTVVAARCARGCRPLGSGRYQVRRGSRGHARAKLNRAGRKLLARRGQIRIRLTMRTRAAGKTSVKRRTVVVEKRSHSRRKRS